VPVDHRRGRERRRARYLPPLALPSRITMIESKRFATRGISGMDSINGKTSVRLARRR